MFAFCEVNLIGSITAEIPIQKNDDFKLSQKSIISESLNINSDLVSASLNLNHEFRESESIHTLDEALITMQFLPTFSAILGKDKLFEGIAYAWNPANLFNANESLLFEKSNLSEKSENPYYVSLNYFHYFSGLSIEFSSLAVTKEYLDDIAYVLKTKLNFYSFDFFTNVALGNSLKPVIGTYARFSPIKLSGLVIYGESQNHVEDLDHYKYLAGLQINPNLPLLGKDLQVILEFYKNKIPIENNIPIIGSSNENYFYIGLLYLNSTIVLSNGLIVNIDDDNGMMLNLNLEYNMTDSLKIYSNTNLPLGDDNSEFKKYLNDFEISIGVSLYFDFFDQDDDF